MNRENIKYMIEVMRHAQRLDMANFQSGAKVCTSIEDLHACGNDACFAGYMAISDKFVAEHGKVSSGNGTPMILRNEGVQTVSYRSEWAVALWLEIPYDVAFKLVYGRQEWDNEAERSIQTFYPVPFEEVKPEHVIEKLQLILSGELA